jgi:hypothetical protein
VPVAHACNLATRRQRSLRPYLKKPFTKIGSVEWLKLKALSSSPSTAKEKEKIGITKSVYKDCFKVYSIKSIACCIVCLTDLLDCEQMCMLSLNEKSWYRHKRNYVDLEKSYRKL